MKKFIKKIKEGENFCNAIIGWKFFYVNYPCSAKNRTGRNWGLILNLYLFNYMYRWYFWSLVEDFSKKQWVTFRKCHITERFI